MDLIHFDISEFDSPDIKGSGQNMQTTTLQMIDLARSLAGVPFIINSGYRTEYQNKKVNGSPKSSHLHGYAVDVKCSESKRRYAIIDAALQVGFHRLGIYPTFIHMDNDPQKAPRIWIG